MSLIKDIIVYAILGAIQGFSDKTLNFIRPLRQKGIFMGFLSGLFHSRDKPTNSTNGSAYCFLFGGSNSGKAVNERSAMQ